MAKTAQMEQQDRIHAWEQSTTRQEILAAARRVVERDGVFEASLTSVAREANFAPTSVYAYFTNKNDLLQAVVADDLTVLTRAMRDAADNKSEDAKAPEAGRSSEQLPLYSLPPRPQLLAIAESRRDPESAKLKEPSSDAVDTIAQLQQTVAKLEIRPVDAWLERRLREFERALAALEERHKKRAGRDGETSEDVVQESVRDLRERLDQLEGPQRDLIEGKLRGIVERMDGSEQRLRQSVHDMQGEMAQVGRRLTALENAAFAASPEFFQRIPAHPTAQIPPPPEPPALKLVTGEKTDEQETADPVSDSYLAAARR